MGQNQQCHFVRQCFELTKSMFRCLYDWFWLDYGYRDLFRFLLCSLRHDDGLDRRELGKQKAQKKKMKKMKNKKNEKYGNDVDRQVQTRASRSFFANDFMMPPRPQLYFLLVNHGNPSIDSLLP
jgi:hypothetical protein